MVGGQALDIAAAGSAPLDLAATTDLQALKTGALFGWAVESGAILGRSDPTPLHRYAEALGLAFQIRDDILDVEGDSATLGKTAGKDAADSKPTYPAILGMDASRTRLAKLTDDAIAALAPLGGRARELVELARYVAERES
jgi:farnesyl diphosphate synthase